MLEQKIADIRAQLDAAIAEAKDPQAIEAIRVQYLGKKGLVTDLMKELKDVPNDQIGRAHV